MSKPKTTTLTIETPIKENLLDYWTKVGKTETAHEKLCLLEDDFHAIQQNIGKALNFAECDIDSLLL